jgi:PAS domain S-box-containing protein
MRKSISSALNAEISQEVFDAAPIGMALVSRDCHILRVNPAICNFLGYTERELLGKTVQQITHPADWPVTAREVDRMWSDGVKIGQIEKRYFHKSAKVLWAQVKAWPVRDKRGRIAFHVSLVVDITERKQTEEALRSSEKQYRDTVDSLEEAIHVVDEKLRIIFHNRVFDRWCDRLRLPRAHAGQFLFDVFPFLSKRVRNEYRRVFRTGRTVITEETTKVDGGKVTTETHKIPVLEGGKVQRVITVMRDNTRRKEMDESLRMSEQIYREIFNATSEAIAVEDALTGRFVEVNDPMVKMYGFASKEELMACSIGDISEAVPPYTQERALELHRLVMSGSPQVFEWMAKKKSGELFHVEVSLSLSPIRGENRMLAVVRDISARKRAEKALLQSEERYRSLFEQARDSIVIFDPDTVRILDFNDEACRHLGYTREEFARLKISDFDVFESTADVKHHSRHVISKGEVVFETKHKTKAGAILDIEVRPKPIDIGGKVLIQAIWRDITDQKRAEAALQEAHETLEQKVKDRTTKLRALANQLVSAEEKERQRIAQVLHEDLQQMMTGARLMLTDLQERHPTKDAKRVTDRISQILEEAIRVTRSLTLDLRPPALYEAGLVAALKWLTDDMKEKFGLTVQVQSDKAVESKSKELRVFIFEAIRELLLNVVKHAGVKTAQVTLSLVDRKDLQVVVEDRGKGFSAVPRRSTGFGLFSLRERTESLGGELTVTSARGNGTRVTLKVPT